MTVFVVLVMRISLLTLAIDLWGWYQPHKSIAIADDQLTNKCVSTSGIDNKALTDTIRNYIKSVSDSELPIILIHNRQDTTFYYVSAVISTYVVQRNIPTSIITDFGREALLYDYSSKRSRINKTCQRYLIDKYKKILHADKVKAKEGLPYNTPDDFTYDPILVKIAVVKNKPTTLMSRIDSLPYFRY